MISCGKIFRRLAVIALAACAVAAIGQDSPAQRTIAASKADVERALKNIETGGRLPILDGFVSSTEPLDRYRRGYYQYSIEVTPAGHDSSVVRATAKITAWYEGQNAASSGYRVLTSNGRLESDLLDQLEDALKAKSASTAAPVTAKPHTEQPTASASTIPDAPHPATTPIAGLTKPAASVPLPQPAATSDKHLQDLRDEAANLQQILENQAHPANLAIIKQAHTPIYARPIESSKVVLEADAEDEFQIIESEAAWVHVQVSGLSRGWIRRSSVELPTEVAAKIEAAPEEADHSPKDAFRQTREETSLFPGKWQPLDGKKVKIIWVQPFESKGFGQNSKLVFAKSVFRQQYSELSKEAPSVAGIVVVFDSADGGMAAATFASLQQWRAGHLTEEAFWKQCWLDPADAFKKD